MPKRKKVFYQSQEKVFTCLGTTPFFSLPLSYSLVFLPLQRLALPSSKHNVRNSPRRKEIEALVSANTVQIFSKSYCPYCKRAKGVFDSDGISYNALELDQKSNGAEFQATLAEMTGQRTVPSVWINGKFVGGSDKVVELQQNGRLQQLVSGNKDL
jgi:glutaredoxin 3